VEVEEEVEAEDKIKSLAKREVEEAEAKAEIESPAKGEAEDTPKSPTQQEHLTTSWADLFEKEDPLCPTKIQSMDQSNEWQMVSKKKKNFQPRSDVMTQSRSGSLK
jgi:hypothetical protein